MDSAVRHSDRIGSCEISGLAVERCAQVLNPQALGLLASLHRRFEARRLALLADRGRRQAEIDAGANPDFLTETAAVPSQPDATAVWTRGPDARNSPGT